MSAVAEMIVSINQPAYLPWLGYFDRLAKSDLHIVLDHVQFEKNSFTNRNKVRSADGWTWLTVPVSTKGRFRALPVMEVEVEVANQSWRRKHLATILQAYSRAAYFHDYEVALRDYYSRDWRRLADLCAVGSGLIMEALGIKTPLLSSSSLKPRGAKSELVLELCVKTGASAYLAGPLSRNYLDEASFVEAGIAVIYHDYIHPTYQQVYPGFEPNMSALDLIANHGPASREILRGAVG